LNLPTIKELRLSDLQQRLHASEPLGCQVGPNTHFCRILLTSVLLTISRS
jgi:hypothetical protein